MLLVVIFFPLSQVICLFLGDVFEVLFKTSLILYFLCLTHSLPLCLSFPFLWGCLLPALLIYPSPQNPRSCSSLKKNFFLMLLKYLIACLVDSFPFGLGVYMCVWCPVLSSLCPRLWLVAQGNGWFCDKYPLLGSMIVCFPSLFPFSVAVLEEQSC